MTTAAPVTSSESIAARIDATAQDAERIRGRIAEQQAAVEALERARVDLEADRALGQAVGEDDVAKADEALDAAGLALRGLETALERLGSVEAELASRRGAAELAEISAAEHALETQWRAVHAAGAEHLAAVAAAARELLQLRERDRELARQRIGDQHAPYSAQQGHLRNMRTFDEMLEEYPLSQLETLWQHMALPDEAPVA